MAKKIETILLPDEFYLVETQDGYAFYREDPMKAADKESARIDLGAVIANFVGHCDVGNPIKLRVRAGLMDRTRPFDAAAPERIRKRMVDAHLADFEGNLVEMLPGRTGNVDFPFLGAVIDREGNPVAFRNYSPRGECEDQVYDHRIVVVDGVVNIAAVEKPKDDKPDTANEEEATPAADPKPEEKDEEAPKSTSPKKRQLFGGKKSDKKADKETANAETQTDLFTSEEMDY